MTAAKIAMTVPTPAKRAKKPDFIEWNAAVGNLYKRPLQKFGIWQEISDERKIGDWNRVKAIGKA